MIAVILKIVAKFLKDSIFRAEICVRNIDENFGAAKQTILHDNVLLWLY